MVYWPSEVGSSMDLGSMNVSNNDSKNKHIYIRELEISIEENDYVRSCLQNLWFFILFYQNFAKL